MRGERNKLYDSAHNFFDAAGSGAMKLSADAAIAVCVEAANRKLVIARVEGGIWHNPGFEARLDCIWDGADPPLDHAAVVQNNIRAADFIRRQRETHDAFILTAPPLSGWPHKGRSSK